MCITNDDLSKGRGNGTLCKCIKIKLKKGKRRRWKNWEGKKVWTASIDDVAWVEFEHFPEPPKGKAKRFRLTPRSSPLPLLSMSSKGSLQRATSKLEMPLSPKSPSTPTWQRPGTSCRVCPRIHLLSVSGTTDVLIGFTLSCLEYEPAKGSS